MAEKHKIQLDRVSTKEGDLYLVPNSMIDKPNNGWTKFESGYLVNKNDALGIAGAEAVNNSVLRDFDVLIIKDGNSEGVIVSHEDFVDVGMVNMPLADTTIMNTRSVHLYNDDCARYVERLNELGLSFKESVGDVKMRRTSSLLKYSEDNLLTSFYVGRSFTHRDHLCDYVITESENYYYEAFSMVDKGYLEKIKENPELRNKITENEKGLPVFINVNALNFHTYYAKTPLILDGVPKNIDLERYKALSLHERTPDYNINALYKQYLKTLDSSNDKSDSKQVNQDKRPDKAPSPSFLD